MECKWYHGAVIGVATAVLLAVAATVEEPPRTVSGEVFSLDSMLSHGPVLLVFWNTWLPRSDSFLKLLPDIEAAATKHGWRGALVVFQDSSEAGRRVAARRGPLVGVLDRRGELVRRFQVTKAPAVLLIDTSARVRGRSGPAAEDVRKLLDEMGDR